VHIFNTSQNSSDDHTKLQQSYVYHNYSDGKQVQLVLARM